MCGRLTYDVLPPPGEVRLTRAGQALTMIHASPGLRDYRGYRKRIPKLSSDRRVSARVPLDGHIITISNEQKWPLGIGDKSKTNFFIKHFGKRQKEMARHVRFWTGHMPCGAFRERFHLDGYAHCWYCKAYEDCEVLETRDHILFECRGWGRAFTDHHIVYEETDITPLGPIDKDGHFDKTPQFRWLSDQEIWEAHEEYHTCKTCE